MPTRNVNLTSELDRFIAAKVDAGLYANASEVMRAALRLLVQDERSHERQTFGLRTPIDTASGPRGRRAAQSVPMNRRPDPPLKGGVFTALRSSPLVGSDLDLSRPSVSLRKVDL